jgi:hypothetical protein
MKHLLCKSVTKAAVLFLFVFQISIAFAQQRPDSVSNGLSVNGIHLNNKYSMDALYKAWGTPTSVDSWTDEFGWGKVLNYDDASFEIDEQQGFYAFSLRTTKYSVNNGFLKVGDNIGRLLTLKNCRMDKVKDGTIEIYFGLCDSPIVVKYNEKDIITVIYYVELD